MQDAGYAAYYLHSRYKKRQRRVKDCERLTWLYAIYFLTSFGAHKDHLKK